MKKGVWVRITSIGASILFFLGLISFEIAIWHVLWQLFGFGMYSSSYEMMLVRAGGASVISSLKFAIIPIIIGELAIKLNEGIMKKAVHTRIVSLCTGVAIFLGLMAWEVVCQYSLWQEFGEDKYLSFPEMVIERCGGSFYISLMLAAITVIIGEAVIIFIMVRNYIANKKNSCCDREDSSAVRER